MTRTAHNIKPPRGGAPTRPEEPPEAVLELARVLARQAAAEWLEELERAEEAREQRSPGP